MIWLQRIDSQLLQSVLECITEVSYKNSTCSQLQFICNDITLANSNRENLSRLFKLICIVYWIFFFLSVIRTSHHYLKRVRMQFKLYLPILYTVNNFRGFPPYSFISTLPADLYSTVHIYWYIHLSNLHSFTHQSVMKVIFPFHPSAPADHPKIRCT